MTGQPRKHSFAEAVINCLLGYGVSVLAQVLIFPGFGIHVPLAANMKMGCVFTGVSIARQYCLRRVFNHIHLRRIYDR